MQNRRIVVLLSAVLGLMATVSQAQNTITFTAKDARNAASVTLDSIHIHNLSRGRDTTITGGSFPVDWPLTTSVGETSRPGEFSISGNYPNSFSTSTAFTVITPEAGALSIAVYDMAGLRVAQYRESLQPGQHEFAFSAGSLPDGVYFVTAALNGRASTLKLLKSGRSAGGNPQIIYRNWSAPGTAPVRKSAAADVFTYTGYAAGYFPAVLANVLPLAGRNYEFLLLSVGSRGISTGAPVFVYEMDVPIAGGTVTVNTEDCPLKGMAITVPDSAFPESRTFSISYAPVQSHSFGVNFNPISPMIIVGNGGGYSDEPMIITIPVKIPAGEFAMAFLYNELTGTVEGMPILAEDASSITVVTRHFATSNISGFAPYRNGPSKRSSAPFANLIVSSIKESHLTGQQILSTGFVPGKDDWEYPNWGSVIAPKGHCAGQSLTMMWYYYEKQLGGGKSLFHSLDRFYIPCTNGDSLWQDNIRGYKFSSVIQMDYLRVSDWLEDKLKELRDSSTHYIGWRALYSMLVTGEPQFVGLRRKKIDGNYSGHAILTHKISVSEKKLFVTDPNYPGQERFFLFSDPYFAPYNTKQNANEVNTGSYPWIAYIAKSCLVDWATITQRWSEVEAGTIGTVQPYIFPHVSLEDKTENKIISPSTPYIVNRDTLAIWAPQFDTYIAVYDAISGKRIIPAPQSPYPVVEDSIIVLKSGANELGVYFATTVGERDVFADFQWLTVIYNALYPNVATIQPTDGKAGTELTIIGSNFGKDQTKGEVHLFTSTKDVRCSEIVSWDTNRIVVKIPTNGISGNVYVKINGVESRKIGAPIFSFIKGDPFLISITPDHGYPGDEITIIGTNFNNSGPAKCILFVNNIRQYPTNPNQIPLWTDSLIRVILPNTCVGGDIRVDWSDTTTSNALPFTMDDPVVTGFGPSSGPAYTVVTITGNNLGSYYWPATGLTLNGIESQYVQSRARTEWTFKAGESGDVVLTVCGKPLVVGHFTKTP